MDTKRKEQLNPGMHIIASKNYIVNMPREEEFDTLFSTIKGIDLSYDQTVKAHDTLQQYVIDNGGQRKEGKMEKIEGRYQKNKSYWVNGASVQLYVSVSKDHDGSYKSHNEFDLHIASPKDNLHDMRETVEAICTLINEAKEE